MRILTLVGVAVVAALIIVAVWPRGGSDLTGRDWRLASITETTPSFQGVVPAAQQGKFTLRFAADGTLAGQADCNAFAGTYTTGRSGALTITIGASTLVACPNGSYSDLYVHALATATGYTLADEELTITLQGGGSLGFVSGAAPSVSSSAAAIESSPSATATPEATATAKPTETPTASPTASPTATPEATATPTAKPTATPTAEPTETPEPTATPKPTPTAEPTEKPTAKPTEKPTAKPTATPEPTPKPTPTPSPTPAPTPAPGADLVGRVWHLTAITERDPTFQGAVPVADQDRYTIEFQAGGTFAAQADCNRVSGTWTATASGGLTITVGPSSIAACPEGSLSDLYILGLSNAASYATARDLLTITLADQGTLVYR